MTRNTRKLVGVILMLAMLVAALAALTVTAAAATEYSYEFSAKQYSANGSATLGDVDWTLAGDGGYWGYDGTKGHQFGSGSKPYKSLTLSTSASAFTNVTKVVVNTSGASSIQGSLTVTVGGTQIGSAITLTKSATEYTFESSTPLNGAVVLSYTQTSSKAIYIKSIAVTYTENTGGCTEHTPVGDGVVTAPTCTVGGFTTYTCATCESQYVADETEATGHSYDAGVVTSEPNCSTGTAGVTTYSCTNDGCVYSYTTPIAAEHSFVDGTCTVCGKTEPKAIFDLGESGTAGSEESTAISEYTETNNDYTLTLTDLSKVYFAWDASGNGCLKLGTGSAVGSFNFTVPSDVTSVVIYVAGRQAKTCGVVVNGTEYDIQTVSNNSEYTAIEVDTTTTKTITFVTSTNYRAMIESIHYYVNPSVESCEHSWNDGEVTTEATCTTDGLMTYTCSLNGCTKTEAIPATGHNYVDSWCACGYPEPGLTLSIPQATTLGTSLNGAYTAGKYYMTVIIVDVYNTQYGNMNVKDADGNTFVIYGTYSADGETRYDAMADADKPQAGDIITVYGVIGSYNGSAQMKNGWLTDIHSHEYTSVVTAPTCTVDGYTTYTCACGDTYTGNVVTASGHSYFYPCDIVCQVCYEETNPDATHTTVHVEAVEATCTENGNIEYWYCSDCGYAWADEALTQVTNQMSVVVPAAHEYYYACDAHCMNCGELTNENASHTITHVEAVEATCTSLGNIEYWTCSDCGGAWADEDLKRTTNLMSVKTFKNHEYFYPCDPVCMICYEITNPDAAHTTVHVEAVAATCGANGNIEYWYCSDCGTAWADEALTQQTNRFNVITPATGEHSYDNFSKVVIVDGIPYAVYACECEATENRSIYTSKGGSIRYLLGDGTAAPTNAVSLRIGYQIDINAYNWLKANGNITWGWNFDFIAADGVTVAVSGSKEGKNIAADGTTSVVFTDVKFSQLAKKISVVMSINVTVGEETVTISDANPVVKTTLEVLEGVYGNPNDAAYDYVCAVLGEYKNYNGEYALPSKED